MLIIIPAKTPLIYGFNLNLYTVACSAANTAKTMFDYDRNSLSLVSSE